MNPDEFTAAIKTVVFDAAVADVGHGLRSGPPGRRPGERAVALHDWFTDLAGDDQRFVVEVARDAAHAAVFGLLCVLDGVRAIDDPPHEQLRLVSVTPDGTETILNPEGSDLHDRLNALVHPPTEGWPRP